jgi:hypothetical protein
VLIARFAWFTHGSATARFDGIKERGLRLSNPYTRTKAEPVEGPCLQTSSSVICLQPFPKTKGVSQSMGYQAIEFAQGIVYL